MPQVQGQAELHSKFQANQSTETLSKKNWGGGSGEGDTIQTRTRLIAQLTLEMCLHLICPPHPPTFLVQMLTNSKKLEKGVKEEKPRTWLSSS